MPDLLILDMEMPKRSDLKIILYPDGSAAVFPHLEKPRGVDAVELPEHGDLIDKQATFKALSEKFKSSDGLVSWTDAIGIVLRAPVMIPANKEALT